MNAPEIATRKFNDKPLPLTCPGCGAFSQTIDEEQAGFYNANRSAVKAYVRQPKDDSVDADVAYKRAIANLDSALQKRLGLGRVPEPAETLPPAPPASPPVCDRCHTLIHYHQGVSVHNPSIGAIADTIAESPHKNNHIYHVLDAADFPMSLIPQLRKHLSLSRQRSRNRRSRVKDNYVHGGLAEMSFIITRSDLLAPKKEMVDKMMPQLIETLRDALGREGRDIRLGNVRCVSAKRGWWTKEVKEAIWKRGGGGWMVGKVNVGKSNLFESVFPKGRGGQAIDVDKMRREAVQQNVLSAGPSPIGGDQGIDLDELPFQTSPSSAQPHPDSVPPTDFYEVDSLLPPAPQEVPFPAMPLISSLPGTTASPIRIPFGDGRGELIDLPGLDRSTFDQYIKVEHRLEAVMTQRIKAKRQTLKPGQSLLLDGLVRITPTRPDDVVFMTHAFVPLQTHVTATGKALEVEAGERAHALGDKAVADFEKIKEKGGLKSAGKFKLEWDVTGAHAGPLVRRMDVGLKVDKLPWRTYAADVLIEGCGWVEIVVEVRKRRRALSQPETMTSQMTSEEDLSDSPLATEELQAYRPSEFVSELVADGDRARKEEDFPEVEIFAPERKFIGIRRPLNAWLVGGLEQKPRPKGAKGRPRRSMKSLKAQRRPANSA